MKVYTKSGDKGKTSLLSGERVPKSDIRLSAYGTIDELNSFIGLLHSLDLRERHKTLLLQIQHKLFNIGALVAVRKAVSFELPGVGEDDIKVLEEEIDYLNENIPSLKEFVLPGGDTTSAQCHVCRSVCRRAERLVIDLADKESVDELVIKYLNRLSDYFFMLARMNLKEKNIPEITWKP